MSFLAAPPVPAAPVDDAVAGDDWWPALSIAKFRDAIRLGTLVTDGRARDALIAGVLGAHVALADWRMLQEVAGATRLEEVAGPIFAGEKRAVLLWRRAVYAYAAADLAETQNDITATDAGRARTEQRAVSADDHRRNAIVAVRDLLGRTRSRVGLL